jgi:hypothetical protein
MKLLNKKDLKELIIKCWITHDGMWFFHCLQECGIEKTNIINKAASRSLGIVEVKRFKKVFGVEDIKTFAELKDFIEKILDVVKADFMKFSYKSPTDNIYYFEMHQCFAYEGIKQIGVIEQYNCGIYDRIESWFESLGIKYSASPQIEGCLKHKGKKCVRKFTFFF